MKVDTHTIRELSELRRRVAELECFEAEFLRTRDDLRITQEQYQEVCARAFEFIFEHDLEGVFTQISSSSFEDLGFTREELLLTNMRDLMPPSNRPFFDAYLERILQEGREEGLMIVNSRDGGERIIEYRNALIKKGQTPCGVRGVARDVTDRLKAEVELGASEKSYHAFLAHLEDAYFEVDLKGNLAFFNPALSRILGYDEGDLAGQSYRRFMDASTAERISRVFAKVYHTGNPTTAFDWEVLRKDGASRYIETVVSLRRSPENGEVVGYQGIARDVTARRQNEERLAYLAYHDALTGLHNRKAFLERLTESLLHSCRYGIEQAILYIDLDNFKQVNDRHGHDLGDEVLKEVAVRLVASLRETDYISRLGGDEFTVILTNPNGLCADVVAQRILRNLSAPYVWRGVSIDFIAPSIGISIFPRDGDEAEVLLKKADAAMYRAKRSGGRFEYFEASMPVA